MSMSDARQKLASMAVPGWSMVCLIQLKLYARASSIQCHDLNLMREKAQNGAITCRDSKPGHLIQS